VSVVAIVCGQQEKMCLGEHSHRGKKGKEVMNAAKTAMMQAHLLSLE